METGVSGAGRITRGGTGRGGVGFYSLWPLV